MIMVPYDIWTRYASILNNKVSDVSRASGDFLDEYLFGDSGVDGYGRLVDLNDA